MSFGSVVFILILSHLGLVSSTVPAPAKDSLVSIWTAGSFALSALPFFNLDFYFDMYKRWGKGNGLDKARSSVSNRSPLPLSG